MWHCFAGRLCELARGHRSSCVALAPEPPQRPPRYSGRAKEAVARVGGVVWALVDTALLSGGRYQADVIKSKLRLRQLRARISHVEIDVADKALKAVASVHSTLSVGCGSRGCRIGAC